MTLRTGHGNGAGTPHIEVLPADELPKPIPAPEAVTAVQMGRSTRGRFTSESAREAGRRGGSTPRKKATPLKLARKFGLGRLIDTWKSDEHIEKFIVESEAWFVSTCEELARDVGGGQLSPGCTSILRSSAYQRAFSNFLYDCATRATHAWETLAPHDMPNAQVRVSPRTDILVQATRLADSSRQNYLAAFEIAAREAQARAKARTNEPYDVGAALQLGDGEKR